MGFEVVPRSVMHSWTGDVPDTVAEQQKLELSTCPLAEKPPLLKIGGADTPKHIAWTYDVAFEVRIPIVDGFGLSLMCVCVCVGLTNSMVVSVSPFPHSFFCNVAC